MQQRPQKIGIAIKNKVKWKQTPPTTPKPTPSLPESTEGKYVVDFSFTTFPGDTPVAVYWVTPNPPQRHAPFADMPYAGEPPASPVATIT